MIDAPEPEDVKPHKPALEDVVPDCEKQLTEAPAENLDTGGGGSTKPPKPGLGG